MKKVLSINALQQSLVIFVVFALNCISFLYAQQPPSSTSGSVTQIDAAVEALLNRQIVGKTETYQPSVAIASIAYIDKENVLQFYPVLPLPERDVIKPISDVQTIFQKVFQEDIKTTTKFLLFNIDWTKNKYVEITAQKVSRYEFSNLFGIFSKKNYYNLFRYTFLKLKEAGCKNIKFVTNVEYGIATAKMLTEGKFNGSIGYIDAKGDYYRKDGEVVIKEIITWGGTDVEIILETYKDAALVADLATNNANTLKDGNLKSKYELTDNEYKALIKDKNFNNLLNDFKSRLNKIENTRTIEK